MGAVGIAVALVVAADTCFRTLVVAAIAAILVSKDSEIFPEACLDGA